MTRNPIGGNSNRLHEDVDLLISMAMADFRDGAFFRGFRAWANDPGRPVTDPQDLLAQDNIDINSFASGIGLLNFRDQYIGTFGFCVPTPELVEQLARIGPILEVGAGTGYLSRLVRDAGGDIEATDISPRENGWTEVEALDARQAQSRYPGRTLLSSWPSLGGDWLSEAVLRMQSGDRLVMIGEGPGGCTGSDSFYKLIGREILPAPDLLSGADVWRFPCIHDTAQAFRRA